MVEPTHTIGDQTAAAPVGAPRSVPDFGGLRVLVVGDSILDGYIEGTPKEVCREAPVAVVDNAREVLLPGGAANTAVNVAALGARCEFLSLFGEDTDGDALERLLVEAGVDTRRCVRGGDRTLSKRRVVADGQTLVRFDSGPQRPIGATERAKLLRRLERAFGAADVVVLSDYRYGVVSEMPMQALAVMRERSSALLVVDSRTPAALASLSPDVVKPNRQEAASLLEDESIVEAKAGEFVRRGRKILEASGASIAAVTLDGDGVVVVGTDLPVPIAIPARACENPQAAGAGDTYLAAFALTLVATGDVLLAAQAGSSAAHVVVVKPRTAVCRRDELDEAMRGPDKAVAASDLPARLGPPRSRGERIVFTNGCFDLLHNGHVDLLNRAKALGDLLVVAINDDDSVRKLKGNGRPVMQLEERLRVLAGLSAVDVLVPFSGDTAEELVRRAKPDVYVKSDEIPAEDLPEAAEALRQGGEVHLLPRTYAVSTSDVVARVLGNGQERKSS